MTQSLTWPMTGFLGFVSVNKVGQIIVRFRGKTETVI